MSANGKTWGPVCGPKLSAQQIKMLRSARNKGEPFWHVRLDEMNGALRTRDALIARGFLRKGADKLEITDAGRKALAETEAR